MKCNCDAAAEAWNYDDGQLTDRDHLPVTKINIGKLDQPGQDARVILGPLYCGGQKVLMLEL